MESPGAREPAVVSYCHLLAAASFKENQGMKRIRVAPGKFVTISDELAEKAARLFATGQLTRDQVRELMAAEPQRSTGAMAGSPRLLGRVKVRASSRPKIRAMALARKGALSSALRRRMR